MPGKAPKRSPFDVWGQWLAVTAAFTLIDGGVYAFFWPYPTIEAIYIKSLNEPFSFTGLYALILAGFIFMTELPIDTFKSLRDAISALPKAVLYALSGLFLFMQFTLTWSAIALWCSALVYIVATISPEE
ncbi:hypothetical protein HK102_004844 [Quaeritorhiza haematococci]|nr:hypothetical protein HK102_004844 [Quaeritorhiza haematococci]